MTLTFKLRKAEIAAIPASEKAVEYQNDEIRQLRLKVLPTGKKRFLVYQRFLGKPTRFYLPKEFSDGISIEADVRKKAYTWLGWIAEGKNPYDEEEGLNRPNYDRETFAKLFDRYLDEYAKIHTKTWKQAENLYKRFLSELRPKPAKSITQDEVAALHRKIGESSKFQADNVLVLLRAVFNWGKIEPNPAKVSKTGKNGIKKMLTKRQRERMRFLLPHEIKAFFDAVNEEESETARDFFLLCLYTGIRKTNVLEMRWDQLNLEWAHWTIPDTKSGEPHIVALTADSVDILKRRALYAASEWVFEGKTKDGHFNQPYKAWDRIKQRSGLTDLRIHDLRRSLGSWAANSNVSLQLIGQALGHKGTDATEIYARLMTETVRQAKEQAIAAIHKHRETVDG